jgi:hypothetical protein
MACSRVPLALLMMISLTLGACASTPRQARPLSPTVLALPTRGESFATFQQHDATCQLYASNRVGVSSPGSAAVKSTAQGAAAGAAVGAAAGALLGAAGGYPGHGAEAGAGTGLLAGVLMGGARGRARAAAIQRSYDMAYAQCMIANGDRIEGPYPPRAIYVVPAGNVVTPAYPPPPPPYPPPPAPPPP